jgi:tetratricopeptide (TPR) repeat protein
LTKSQIKKQVKKAMIQQIRKFIQLVSIVPDDIFSWNTLGILFGNLKKHERAIKCLQKVLNFEPENLQAHHNIGVSYGLVENHEQAVEYFKKTLLLEEAFAPAWCNLGVAFTHLYQLSSAAECFQVCDMLEYPVMNKRKYIYAINYKPESIEDYEHYASRGESYFAIGRYNEAIQEYVSALKILDEDPVVWLNVGMAFARTDHHKTAIKCFSISVKLNPQDELPWGFMGMAYSNLGKDSKALQCYEKALQVNPDCSAFKLLKDLITDNDTDIK